MGRWSQRRRRGGGGPPATVGPIGEIIITRVFLVELGGDEVVVVFSAPVNEVDFAAEALTLVGVGDADDVNQEDSNALRYGSAAWTGLVFAGLTPWNYTDSVPNVTTPQSGTVEENV